MAAIIRDQVNEAPALAPRSHLNFTRPYLFQNPAAELERLQLQARVWEPETEALFDLIGIRSGWRCIDLGCGALGVLQPLSRRVGPQGQVVGVDMDARQLNAARAWVRDTGQINVQIYDGDAYHTPFERESFDFTHVRFVFAPAGRDQELLGEMLSLTRPGGIVAIQEPDAASWNCYPSSAAIQDCEKQAADPATLALTFTLIQAWGKKPVR